MSLNTANTPDGKGVLIYNGEAILLYTRAVNMSFNHGSATALKGKKSGALYLTSHRMIFVSQMNDGMRSFSMPFFALRDVTLEQPILSPNYLKGNIQAQPGGNFDGEVTWKLSFPKGGCIDFGQALLQAADMAQRYRPFDAPPSYAPAPGNYNAAPPGYVIPPNTNYYGFTAPTHVFPEQPPAGEVYMYESPPPYPGIAGPAIHVDGPAPYPAGQAGYPTQPYHQAPNQPYPQQQPYPQSMPSQPYPQQPPPTQPQPQNNQPPPYSAYGEAGPLPQKN